MKIALVAALALVPLPAAAQSLHETHERIWHPSGKTPMLTYRMRDRATCSETTGHHQAGKSALPVRSTCVAAKPSDTKLAAVDQTPQLIAAR